MKQQDSNNKNQPSLDIQLLTKQYFIFQHQPELYLLQIIEKSNPWPTIPLHHIGNFIKSIGKSYKTVAYHNVTHAFDVMTHFDQYLLTYGWQQKLNIHQHNRIFMLIAAYAHDSGHEGLTNAYYLNSNHQWAIDTSSPLQNMHVTNLRNIMREHNIQIPKQVMQELTQMILKTDNSYHSQLISNFSILKGMNQTELRLPKNALMINCTLLHAADLNNAGKDLQLGSKWSNKLYIQFKNQAIREQKESLPISFSKNWDKLCEMDSTIWFLDHMGAPLFKCLSNLQPKFTQIYNRIVENQNYWVKLKQKEIESVKC